MLKIDVASKALTDLTPNYDRLFIPSSEMRFDIAPDGRHITLALNSIPPPYAEQPNTDIVLLPTDGSGTFSNLTPDNRYGDGQSAERIVRLLRELPLSPEVLEKCNAY